MLPSGLVVVAAACSSPASVVFPPLEVVVASGDSQYGTSGQTLGLPLQVVVRTVSGKVPTRDVDVLWEIAQGDASVVGIARTVTDSTGSTDVHVRLGGATGLVEVRATAQAGNSPSASFELHTVDVPVLEGVSPAAASPGTSITLIGMNFSPVASQSVVLFSGVRGRVLQASETSLTVEVPPCLPARSVSVSVQLGVVASQTVPFTVEPGGDVTNLQIGGVADVADDDGFACLALAGDGAQYLTIAYSTSTVGAAKHPYRLTGLSSTGAPTMVDAEPARRSTAVGERETWPAAALGSDAQGAWDVLLRELEGELVETRLRTPAGGAPSVPALTAPARVVPAVGARRTFNVFQGDGDFTQVTAVASHVGSEVVLFVDESAPGDGFTVAELQTFADRFDDVIHPVVTGAFGATSDLDANERVLVLFSPAVNALTPRGANGFVGGFFYGLDLLPEREGSNGGEVFYAIVPDPNGQYSDPRSKQDVLGVTPAILAHEFQHMVHFNERFLALDAASAEAVWLSEALAQFAEELVARAYLAEGATADVTLFRSGTRSRARSYLTSPDTVALIISTGQGSLAERGAGYLFMTYLEDHGGADLPRRMTRTTRRGVENVEAESGRTWERVLADWWGATYLDGPGPETGDLRYPDVDLRGLLGNPFPLVPVGLGEGDFQRDGTLWSSSAAYYIVAPPAGGVTALRVGGEAGGVSAPQAGLRMRVVRIS